MLTLRSDAQAIKKINDHLSFLQPALTQAGGSRKQGHVQPNIFHSPDISSNVRNENPLLMALIYERDLSLSAFPLCLILLLLQHILWAHSERQITNVEHMSSSGAIPTIKQSEGNALHRICWEATVKAFQPFIINSSTSLGASH